MAKSRVRLPNKTMDDVRERLFKLDNSVLKSVLVRSELPIVIDETGTNAPYFFSFNRRYFASQKYPSRSAYLEVTSTSLEILYNIPNERRPEILKILEEMEVGKRAKSHGYTPSEVTSVIEEKFPMTYNLALKKHNSSSGITMCISGSFNNIWRFGVLGRVDRGVLESGIYYIPQEIIETRVFDYWDR